MKSLDDIMSREGEATPEQETPAIETRQVEEQAPAEVHAPEAETQEDDQSGMVPVQALHAERSKARRYTEELAETRRALEELRAAMQSRSVPQAPPIPQEPVAVPDWWDDPDKALAHRAQEMLNPVQQSLMFNARLTAEAIFDREKPGTVKEAEAAFNAAAASGQIDPEIHRRINSSPNPFHAAVQWHQHVKRQEALSKYGDDPDAAFEAEVERRLAARTGGQGAQPSPQTPQAMPSSFAAGRSAGPRTAPNWSGPKPLSEIMNGR